MSDERTLIDADIKAISEALRPKQLGHSLDDCPHNPTFEHFGKTLERLESHAERQALAMEEIARNSAITESHEKRLDKVDHDFRELFGRVRIMENKKADQSHVVAIDDRVRTIETVHATESGSKKVVEEQTKFWDGVKQQVTPFALSGFIFLIWLMDRFNVPVSLGKLWKEMGK